MFLNSIEDPNSDNEFEKYFNYLLIYLDMKKINEEEFAEHICYLMRSVKWRYFLTTLIDHPQFPINLRKFINGNLILANHYIHDLYDEGLSFN